MVTDFAEFYMLEVDAFSAGGAIFGSHYCDFSFFLFEDSGGAASYQYISKFIMIERFSDVDVGHESIEAGGDW